MAIRISRKTMSEGLNWLARRDGDMARVLELVGPPPLRTRKPGFSSLFKSICAQQVSAASARAVAGRLEAATGPLTPANFLALDDGALKAVGLSRQKMSYGRAMAQAMEDGEFSLRSVARMGDEAAIARLTELKGVGRWTAEVYLLFALKRPDIWPKGDLAVIRGLQRMKKLETQPSETELQEMAEPWRPWRSVAARLMWHYYGNAPDEG